MRFVLSLMAVLLLPVLTLVHRHHFQTQLQPALEQRVRDALAADAELKWVKASFSYLDVTLENMVPSLAARERAEEVVRRLGVVRMLPENNRLLIPATLEGRPVKDHLALFGLVHDEGVLKDIAQWLNERRPGIVLDNSEVKISPHVTRMDVRDPSSPDFGLLQQLLRLVTVPATLKITRQGDEFTLSGSLPSGLLETLTAALKKAEPQGRFNTSKLETGPFVKEEQFTSRKALPEFLVRYFSLPDTQTFEADEHAVRFSANVLEAMKDEWQPLLDQLADRRSLQADWHVYPSIYQMASYQPESKLEPQAVAALREVLRKSAIHFIPGSYSLSQEEMPNVNAISTALSTAGTGVKIIVGIYLDPSPDVKASTALAQHRADAVIEQFVDRGLPASWFQATLFGTARAPGSTDDRNVELLVK